MGLAVALSVGVGAYSCGAVTDSARLGFGSDLRRGYSRVAVGAKVARASRRPSSARRPGSSRIASPGRFAGRPGFRRRRSLRRYAPRRALQSFRVRGHRPKSGIFRPRSAGRPGRAVGCELVGGVSRPRRPIGPPPGTRCKNDRAGRRKGDARKEKIPSLWKSTQEGPPLFPK